MKTFLIPTSVCAILFFQRCGGHIGIVKTQLGGYISKVRHKKLFTGGELLKETLSMSVDTLAEDYRNKDIINAAWTVVRPVTVARKKMYVNKCSSIYFCLNVSLWSVMSRWVFHHDVYTYDHKCGVCFFFLHFYC